ncbi:MAG TPA: hypothetical protein VFC42_02955 [Methylomirabilota bacterium]|nr:hypothetical protein [Methylomirabilota bacterium]
MRRRALGVAALVGALAVPAGPAWGHGVVGKRFFPATLAIEDPLVADELALPSVSHIKGPEGKETAIGVELQKRITPDLGLSVGGEYRVLDPSEPEEGTRSGFGNPEVGLKYTLLRDAPHELALSLAFDWEIGGVGSRRVEAESFSTIGPSLLFGKGFGDLPDSLALLRPVAVTGVIGAEIPLTGRESNALTYGLALQYSIPYLQSFVRDVGLRGPLGRLIPIVEALLSTPLEEERTTGTINPGIIWAGRFFEIGVEAIIPISEASGKTVGVRALLHFFLDDLMPAAFRPLLGGPR